MYRIPYENEQITKTIAAPYAPVDFTEEEKAQFRDNIGASSGGADETQINDIKMLGWTVPKDFAVQNYEENGVYHQRVGRVDLGGLEWSGTNPFNALITNECACTSGFCRLYKQKSLADYLTENKTFAFRNQGENQKRIYVNDTSYSTVSAFKTAMIGVYLYYELATEITRHVDGYEVTEPPVLLWENASPSSTFASQSINIDLSAYAFIMIDFKRQIMDTKKNVISIIANNEGEVVSAFYNSRSCFRLAEINNNSISFGAASYNAEYGGNIVTDNSLVVPYRIYGIK